MPTTIKFGTDGWRAIIAEEFTFDNVRLCAQAFADYQRERGLADRGVVVGFDTRFLSDRFAQACAEVLAGNGIHAYLCREPRPTPVVSYAILDRKAGGALMITASHNPYLYNGFKVKPEYAGSASPEVIAALEARIARLQTEGSVRRRPLVEAKAAGLVEEVEPADAFYAQMARLVDLEGLRRAGLHIVHDAMYGAGAGFFRHLLSDGSTTVREIRAERNPNFPGINPEPITQNLGALIEAVRESGATAGLATDGDADRIGLVDETGRFIDQLEVYALLLFYLLEVRGWRGPAVRSLTSTVMADRLGERYGVPVYETPVGFKYVGPKMLETNAIMGGEESGGFGFRGHIPERDAIVAGLFLLDLIRQMGKPISAILAHLRGLVGDFHYHRIDVHFPAEQRDAIVARVASARPAALDGTPVLRVDTADGFKFVLADGSWLLIRFSGTEPLLRIYAETIGAERVPRLLAVGRQLAGV